MREAEKNGDRFRIRVLKNIQSYERAKEEVMRRSDGLEEGFEEIEEYD